MIISPPFLPQAGLTSSNADDPDPMMTTVDAYASGNSGIYPVAFDRRWHGGIHLDNAPANEPVRAIADGEVVAYRISQSPISDGHIDEATGKEVLNTNTGFVLLRHVTDTGAGRTLTYYSLYMHLLDLTAQEAFVGAAPSNPPKDTSTKTLSAWLLAAGDAVTLGGGKKVYRKDILGYPGLSQGLRHLHFEIFMTEEDFTSWFEQPEHTVQLGQKNPVQPTSQDWWGHAYYVIPGAVAFVDRPGTPHDATWFPKLKAGKLSNANSKLYVEVYFHVGQRYMRAWLDENGDGTCRLLTPQPVKDPYGDYEYKLYDRSMALYPGCPSDGYEMLRFGRILSTSPTLTSDADKTTWVAVPFDEDGSLGYVDVNQASIVKLSDADFPFFTGWLKIDDSNAPLDGDGLLSYRKLSQIVGEATSNIYNLSETDSQFSLDDQLSSYVQSDNVRTSLGGFICKTKSEWDPNNNDSRYQGLNNPDGYFGRRKETDPDGYKNFLAFVEKLQFLDKVPGLSGGKSFWHTHPLYFIRHFRKCGWLSAKELAQCLPRKVIDQTKDSAHHIAYPTAEISWNTAHARAKKFSLELNFMLQKYGISINGKRTAYFMGNAVQETIYLSRTSELGGSSKTYAPWYGRGVIQLTFEANYQRYGDFKKWTGSPATYRDSLETDLSRACDSAGFYWVSCAKPVGGTHNINIEADVIPHFTTISLSNVCSNYDYHSRSCRNPYDQLNFISSFEFEKSARAVNTGNANSTGTLNGLIPRTNVFIASIAKLSDFLVDYDPAYAQKE